jgi:hypothetical protein
LRTEELNWDYQDQWEGHKRAGTLSKFEIGEDELIKKISRKTHAATQPTSGEKLKKRKRATKKAEKNKDAEPAAAAAASKPPPKKRKQKESEVQGD